MPANGDSVEHDDVLDLLQRLRKEGAMKVISRLSEIEPVVAPYAAAAAVKLTEYLQGLGLDDKACKTVLRETMLMQAVCIEGVRLGQLRFWNDVLPGIGDDASQGGD